jgi:aryl-alcohol dehydrogenase-like predicted oxidoreductase
MSWSKKICLGTAQFGNIYGITNRNRNELNVKEIKKFLKLLIKNKIEFIDTALNYKNVDKKLKKTKINLNKFNIITKIPAPEIKEKFYKREIFRKILKSKKILKIKSFYAILVHNCNNLNSEQAKLIRDTLAELKKKK